jgi:uncharacterized protein
VTAYFIDTSALVKRYVIERGSNQVERIVSNSAGNRIFVAQITPVELISGLARRVRELSLPVRSMHARRLLIERHTAREYILIPLSDAIITQAKDLLEAHPLRAFDAIQLATALYVEQHLTAAGQTSVVFVCSDQRLLSAASAVGLAVEEPK